MQRCALCYSHRVTTNYSSDESTVAVTIVADLTVVKGIEVVNHAPTSSWFFEFSVQRLDPTIKHIDIHACAGGRIAVIVGCAGGKVVLIDTVETPGENVCLRSSEFDFGILFHVGNLWILAYSDCRRFRHLNGEPLDC